MTAPRARWITGGDHRWPFWLGLAIGWAVIAYAVWGIFDQSGGTNPPQLARWVFGSLVVHDALIAPIATVGGLVLAWFLPSLVRGPILGALALSLIVWVFSIPLVRAYGRHAGNSSTLPSDYGRNVWIVIAAIWVSALAVIVIRWSRSRTGRGEPT